MNSRSRELTMICMECATAFKKFYDYEKTDGQTYRQYLRQLWYANNRKRHIQNVLARQKELRMARQKLRADTYVYPKLQEARLRAAAVGLDPANLTSSKVSPYKLTYMHDGKAIHFGTRWYADNLIRPSAKRRYNYKARHSAILNKEGKPAYTVPFTPAWLAWHVLWS